MLRRVGLAVVLLFFGLEAFPQQVGVPWYVGWQGPFSGVTDSRGYFEIVVLRTGDATHAITGTLYDGMTRRPIANSPVSIRYKGGLGRGTQVEISIPGYQTKIVVVQTTESSYLADRRPPGHKTYGVGRVYFQPGPPGEGTKFTCVTDEAGSFRFPVRELPNTMVVGTLTRCETGRPLSGVPVWVRLNPRTGRISVGTVADVGSVKISSPGYESVHVPRERLRFSSSMDVTGRVQRTIDVGTICLEGGEHISVTAIRAVTDADGKFSVHLPNAPHVTVTGRLMCDGRPLAEQEFSLTPLREADGFSGFRIEIPGREPVTVTEFMRFTFLGISGYALGDVVVPCPYPKPRIILLGVVGKPVYFQAQTVDELLCFRIEAPEGSTVLRLVARLRPLRVVRVYSVGPETHVRLPPEWLPGIEERKQKGLIEIEGWSWALPIPYEQFGMFEILEIVRHDRVRLTPINEVTWFRVQEKELDKIRIRGGDVALGFWELEADIRTPDGRIHKKIRSVSGEKRTLRFHYRDGRITRTNVTFPQLYQIFSHDIPVYELNSMGTMSLDVDPQKATEISSYYASAISNRVSRTQILLRSEIDLTGISGEWTATMGGAYIMLGNPFSPADYVNAEISTKPFYICPMVGDDDLPVETEARVRIEPPAGTYEIQVLQEYRIGWAIGQELAKELAGLLLGAAFPEGILQRGVQKILPTRLRKLDKFFNWLVDKAKDEGTKGLLGLLEEAREGKKIAAFSSVYQGIFELNVSREQVQLVHPIAGGKDSKKGKFGETFEVTWTSLNRPCYQLSTGAAITLFLLGSYEDILYHRVSGSASVELSSPQWRVFDGNNRQHYDPNPDSTWK